MSPMEFIQSAYADVQALTDEGDQMHRRAVMGKPLYVHVHGWDKTAFERPMRGMTALEGGRAVTLRVIGQYMDRGARYTARTTDEAYAFVEAVKRLLAKMPPPVMQDAIKNCENFTPCMLCGYPHGADWLDNGETCPKCKLVQ